MYGLAPENCRDSGRETPAKNDSFCDVQDVSQAFASSEHAEIEEYDGGLDGSDGDGVMDFAHTDVLVHIQL